MNAIEFLKSKGKRDMRYKDGLLLSEIMDEYATSKTKEGGISFDLIKSEVEKGKSVVIYGEQGCGKSSLVKTFKILFCCEHVIDEYAGEDFEPRTLILTNKKQEPQAKLVVLHYNEAVAAIENVEVLACLPYTYDYVKVPMSEVIQKNLLILWDE